MCEICVGCGVSCPCALAPGTPTKPPRDLHEIVGPSRDQLRCAIPTRFSGGGSQERRVRRVCASELGPSDKRNCIRAEAQYLTVRTKKRSRTLLTDCGCVCMCCRSDARSVEAGAHIHLRHRPPARAHTRTHASPSAHPTPHAPKHIYEASICHTNLHQTTRFACTEIQMRLTYGREGLLHPCRCSNRRPRSAA